MTLRRRPTPEEVEHASQGFGQNEQHAQIRELLRRLDWHALWKDDEEEEWIHYPLIPARRLVALFSGPGVGKSLLMLEIAAGLSTGRKVLGYEPAKRYRVLYIDFENDPRGDVRDRLQNMGYGPDDLGHLDYLSFPSIAYLDTPQGANELGSAVDAYGSELVVIDTISRAVMGEENDNDTWLSFYKHSGLAMKHRGVALIRLDHEGKDASKGARGGSAKGTDVDAIWRLSEVIKDERFRLENTKARFLLETKELTLIRHDDPLCHTLEVLSAATDREAKILQYMELADRDDLPTDTGRPKVMEWAKGRGLKARKDVWEEVVKRRRNRAGLVFDTSKDLPQSRGAGQKSETAPEADFVNGAGHLEEPKTPSQNDQELPHGVGGRPGAGPTPETAPLGGVSISTPQGAGAGPEATNGHGRKYEFEPGQRCKGCGREIGAAMALAGLTTHPECQTEVVGS
jgi:hypothetical protein